MRKNLLILCPPVIMVLILSVAAFNKVTHKAELLEDKAMLVSRAIGDQLLRHAGDPTSRVLPVKQLGKGLFQLEFQSAFSFMPDSLVEMVRSTISTHGVGENYIVNVFKCLSDEVVYGFQINQQKNDIIPCLGRMQPYGCYTLQIKFADMPTAAINKTPILLCLSIIAVISILIVVARLHYIKNKELGNSVGGETYRIGVYTFNSDRQTLSRGAGTSILTNIETRLLTILAHLPNQLVTRERLQKEVWEDNGVFTSRSLDMFISKLRKKLNEDDSVKLVNVYGKGYMLQVGESAINLK